MTRSSFLIYLLSGALGRLFPFFLIPVLTRLLTVKQYGSWALFLAVYSFVEPLVTLTSQTYIAKNFFQKERREISVASFNTVLLFCLNSIVLYVLVGFVNEVWLMFDHIYFMMPFLAILSGIVSLGLVIFRSLDRPFLFGFTEITKIGLCFCLAVCFIYFINSSWQLNVYAFTLGTLIVSVSVVFFLRKENFFSCTFDKKVLMEIYGLSLPLLPLALANVINGLADRVIIESIMGTESVGVYSVGYSFGMIVFIFVNAYTRYWGPKFYKFIRIKDKLNDLNKEIWGFLPVFLGLSFVLYLIVDNWLFDLMVPSSYLEAKNVILVIMIACVMQGFYALSVPFFVYRDERKTLALTGGLSALVNIVLNYLFVPTYGIIGAAWATLVSYFLQAIVAHSLNVYRLKKS